MSEPKKRNWMKYVLIASLGLNLIVMGLIVGAKASGHGPMKSPHMGGFGVRSFAAALPKEKRSELGDYFRQKRKTARADGSLREKRAQMHSILTAQPFDAEALSAAFTEQRAYATAVTQEAQAALVKIIVDMSDAERATFADNLKKQKFRKHEKRPKEQ